MPPCPPRWLQHRDRDSTARAQALLAVIRADAGWKPQAQEGGDSQGRIEGTSGNARLGAQRDGTEIPCIRLLVPAG